MIVCLCKGISDRRLHAEIRQGARSLQQVQASCGAGTDCRSCVRQIREILSVAGNARSEAPSSNEST